MPMTSSRWDETWHRLREWTNSQPPSERLAAQILHFDGYQDVDPSHPLGGRDGGKDILCTRDGLRCWAAVYFPRGQQDFKTIKDKFLDDFQKAKAQQPPVARFLFVTNQELRLAQREELAEQSGDIEVGLYHLERITVLLDSPGMQSVRSQFLSIESDSNDGRGGKGGSGYVLGDRATVIAGKGGRGGVGGPGGDGGSGYVAGDDAFIKAGGGGDAGQPGGQGGRGARGPLDEFGTPSDQWGAGRGGRGAGTPEGIHLREVLSRVCSEYLERFPQDAPFIEAGLEQVPTDWLNQRLMELGEKWRVDGDDNFRTPERALAGSLASPL